MTIRQLTFIVALFLTVIVIGSVGAQNLANSIGTFVISTTGNTIKLDQATSAANGVDTDVIGTGFIGSATKDVGIVTPVSIGTLTTGITRIAVTAFDGDAFLGGAGVALNKGIRLASGTTSFFNVSTVTPTMFFLHTVATKTVHIEHLK